MGTDLESCIVMACGFLGDGLTESGTWAAQPPAILMAFGGRISDVVGDRVWQRARSVRSPAVPSRRSGNERHTRNKS